MRAHRPPAGGKGTRTLRGVHQAATHHGLLGSAARRGWHAATRAVHSARGTERGVVAGASTPTNPRNMANVRPPRTQGQAAGTTTDAPPPGMEHMASDRGFFG